MAAKKEAKKMGRIKINIGNVVSASANVKNAGSRLSSVRGSLNFTSGSLDWQIKQRYGIEGRISSAARNVAEAEEILRRVSALMDKAAEYAEVLCRNKHTLCKSRRLLRQDLKLKSVFVQNAEVLYLRTRDFALPAAMSREVCRILIQWS